MTTAEQRAVAATAAMAAAAAPAPSLDAIWRALGAVPDPEIPVVSVVELGIVRGIEWEGADPGTLVVRVTPTYSGCPATELIMAGIRDALAAAGVARLRLGADAAAVALRLDRVQGAVPLRSVPRAVRLLQAALMARAAKASVIPAQAGIQCRSTSLGPRLRGDEDLPL